MKTPFQQFREQVYQNINKRADSIMELVDALSGNSNARSVAELSVEASYRRGYSALYKGIAESELSNEDLAHLAAEQIPAPEERKFWLLAVDVSPHPRLYSETLGDRGCVYQPTVIKGNRPITLGHQYSTVVGLPEKGETGPAWVIPLSCTRVKSTDDKELVGAEQIAALLADQALPFHGQLCASVEDSSYSKPACVYQQYQNPDQVGITRVRSNRVFYRQYAAPADAPAGPGHPRWYGERFALREAETWGEPDEQHSLTSSNCQGKHYRVEVQAWHTLLMRGKRKPTPLPMHECPFTLVRVQLYREDDTPVYAKALWFIIYGARRAEISSDTAYLAYRQRFDAEHAYRFCKQHLLLTNFQTPHVAREETWWRLVHLAYLQLWVARPLAEHLPRPWERYLPSMQASAPMTPSLVQRDFARIIRQFGTPASPPKPRGYSPGRLQGTSLPKRQRQKVILKSKMPPSSD